jgi:hypothetical protein
MHHNSDINSNCEYKLKHQHDDVDVEILVVPLSDAGA